MAQFEISSSTYTHITSFIEHIYKVKKIIVKEPWWVFCVEHSSYLKQGIPVDNLISDILELFARKKKLEIGSNWSMLPTYYHFSKNNIFIYTYSLMKKSIKILFATLGDKAMTISSPYAWFVQFSIGGKWTVNLHPQDICLFDITYNQLHSMLFFLHCRITICLNINESIQHSTFFNESM